MSDVNYLALIVAGIASMIIGYVWYGPLFGKQWMKLSGVTQGDIEAGKKNMPKTYGMMYISSIVMAYVLAQLITLMGSTDVVSGALAGFWIWLGFVATVLLGGVLFEKKSLDLYFLNVGYNLVTLMVMGGIIAGFGTGAAY